MRKIIYVFISIILLLSCQTTTTELTSATVEYQLNKKQTITIPIDNTTNNISLNTYFLEDKNEFVILNTKMNSLQFYEFRDKGKLTNQINMEEEGNNGVGIITEFLIHSKDSIFVLSATSYKLSLLDSKGKVQNTYELFNRDKNANNATPMPFPLAPIILLNGKMHIASSPPPAGSANKKYYASNGCVIILDLKTKKFEYKYTYSEIYQKNIYPKIFAIFHRAYSPKHKKFVHSFMADHHLQVTDYQTNTQYLANSKQLEVVQVLEKEIPDGVENDKIAKQNSMFWGIYYDKFRDIFYRSFIINDKNGYKKTGFIILDTNFQKIGEVEKAPQDGLYSIMPLFTKEGMWLINTKGKENVITFDLFELVKK